MHEELSDGVIELDDFRPHVIVPTPEAIHVIIRVCFENIAAGELPLNALPDDVWRVVVKEWLVEDGSSS